MSDPEDRLWLPKKEAGQRLRELREGVLGMSQQALGVALGYSEGSSAQSTIDQIEKGKRGIPEARLVRLCRLAGVPVTTFMRPDVVEAAPPHPKGEKLIVALHLEKYAEKLRKEATSGDEGGAAPPGVQHPTDPMEGGEGERVG